MTNEQAKKMIKAKLECLKRETSGTDFDCNNSNCDECSLCYEQGNMGEQKEALDMAIKALEQQPCEDTISRQAAIDAVKKNTFRLTFAEEQNCEGHVAWSAEAVYSDVMEGALLDLPSAQPEPIKINIEDFNKEDCERLKKEWGNTPITVLPSAQPEQQIPQMRGWVCPVCGRGLSPYTSVCPCNNGKGWEITC